MSRRTVALFVTSVRRLQSVAMTRQRLLEHRQIHRLDQMIVKTGFACTLTILQPPVTGYRYQPDVA